MRRHLTYANVMATVAVFIALGGTATAAITLTGRNIKNGTITSADIKDGTIKARDIKKRSLTANRFKRNQLPAGPAGPAGATGAPGAPGAAGANATNVGWARVYRETSTAPGGGGGGIGDWVAPVSEGLSAITGGAENKTVCLQFAQPPRGVLAMPASPYVVVRGGVDAQTLQARCAGSPGANAYVFATQAADNVATDAFDAFVTAY
jgi:hypothetical protein